MPSIKNPNTVSRNRQIARAARARKQQTARRGARHLQQPPGLRPTSGPGRALSKKTQRRREKLVAHAVRRREEKEAAAAAAGGGDNKKSKRELKSERDAAMEALGRMDIS